MRRFLVLVATWLALCGGVVVAQQILPGFPPGAFSNKAALDPAAGGGGYTGPGDVVSGAIAWWGLRCYNTAYTGNVADIWDGSTGSTTETLLTCSSGGTINQTVHTLAVTCAVACRVKTLYDQSGNTNCSSAACDLTQATNSARPALTLNCLNTSLPCITFSGSTQILSRASSPTQAQPFTYSTVSTFTSSACGGSTCAILVSDSAGNYVGLYFRSITHVHSSIGAGAAVDAPDGSITTNKWYTHQAVFNGASAKIYQDAVSQTLTGTLGASGMANSLSIGNDTFVENLIGSIAEAGAWGSSFSSGQATSMCHNQFVYWATGTSC